MKIKTRWGWIKDIIPIFILAGLVLIFFQDVLFQNKIFVHRDLTRYFYPLREFSVRQLKIPNIPLWDPYIHCGIPHLAELQTAVFYPLGIVYLIFPYPTAFDYFIVLHIYLAGVFMYVLMRKWHYSKYASFFSATAYMFGGYFISAINLLASLVSATWLPLVVLFYSYSLEQKRWIRWLILTGVCLALMFLGGEPVILLGTILIMLLLGLFGLCSIAGRKRALFCLASALVIAIGLSAFQVLPFLEFIRHTSRPDMSFDEASMWSLPVYALLDLFIPFLSDTDYLYKDYWTRQSWLLIYYMGIFTILCVFISLILDTAKKRKAFFYILAMGLVLSFGRYTPVYYFLYKSIPGFNLSRYPVKFFFMVSFSLAVLAGIGLDYYRKDVFLNHSLKGFAKTILVGGFICSIIYLLIDIDFKSFCNIIYKTATQLIGKKELLPQIIYAGLYNLRRALGIFMVLSIVIFFSSHKKRLLKIGLPMLLLINLSDIFTANTNIYLNMDTKDYLKAPGSIEFLKKDKTLFRIFESPATLFRNTFVPEKDYFEGMLALKERAVSNTPVRFDIYDAYGYGSLYYKRHEELIGLILKSPSPDKTNLLNILNVKYVLSPKDFDAEGYVRVYKNDTINIYENKNVLPRAFMVSRAIVLKDEKDILEKLNSKDFNPAEEVILEKGPVRDIERAFLENGHAEVIEYNPRKVVIRTDSRSPNYLLLSDSYYPGWKAYVDKKMTEIYKADYIFRAVFLEPGRHTVEFIYAPLSFRIGMVVSLGTIFILAVIWLKKRL